MRVQEKSCPIEEKGAKADLLKTKARGKTGVRLETTEAATEKGVAVMEDTTQVEKVVVEKPTVQRTDWSVACSSDIDMEMFPPLRIVGGSVNPSNDKARGLDHVGGSASSRCLRSDSSFLHGMTCEEPHIELL